MSTTSSVRCWRHLSESYKRVGPANSGNHLALQVCLPFRVPSSLVSSLCSSFLASPDTFSFPIPPRINCIHHLLCHPIHSSSSLPPRIPSTLLYSCFTRAVHRNAGQVVELVLSPGKPVFELPLQARYVRIILLRSHVK